MLSSPRRPATTIRIFSSAEYCLRVRRRMARTVASAPSFNPFNFWLIFVPFGRCDEPEILRYANPSICSVGADVRQPGPLPKQGTPDAIALLQGDYLDLAVLHRVDGKSRSGAPAGGGQH